MNIMYIHGFGSKWKPNSDKVKTLSQIGKVSGVTMPYDLPSSGVYQSYKSYIINNDIDLVVGTSLGGFWSAYMGSKMGIPFVAINPAINPKSTLNKYQGVGETYYGEPYNLEQAVINEYPDFPTSGAGLILLDMGDKVLNSKETQKKLSGIFGVHAFDGGSHRFDHIADSKDIIQNFYNRMEVVYGF